MTKINKEAFSQRIAKLFSRETQKLGPRIPEQGSRNDLPEINAKDQDLARITGKVWKAIQRSNEPPRYFRFGGFLCRLESDDDRLKVSTLIAVRLRHELAKIIFWYTLDDKGNQNPAKPPMDVVNNVLATPDPPMPLLNRITEVPVFGPGGTLRTEPGYDEVARLYYSPAPELEVPEVPGVPTPEDIERARSLISDNLFADFPFVGPSDKAHAFALFLLPYCRDLIEGPTPNHLVESPTPGTGKDLLVETCLYSAFGPSGLATLAQATDEEEWRRRITGCLRQPSGAVLIGNVTKPLDSGVLAAVLTARFWSDRILGKNEMTNLPVRHVWTTTANNLMVSQEIARRSIRVRLDAGVERPWLGRDFKHPNLRRWVEENRAELIWAALTLIQAWVANSKPPWNSQPLGSYEGWSAVVGGILEVNGIEGFLGNLDEFYETADAEGAQWGGFVEAWWETFSDKTVGVRDLVPLALASGIDLKGKDDQARRISLGMQMNRRRDQVIGGYRIVMAGKVKRAIQWKLSRIGS
jgi:hypothetical protein